MSSANLGWLFYKDYFQGLDYSDLKSKSNENRIKDKVQNIIDQAPAVKEGVVLGNRHLKATTTYPGLLLGSGNTHELPSIEGQAILGFHFDYTSGLPVIPGSSIKGVLRSAFKHEAYIRELLKDEEANVVDIEKEIFDNGDVFFDAEIIAGSRILGDDYLTPHGDGIKEPIPLRFIKVMPGITFRFDFELQNGLIKAKEKADLFGTILEDLGLGAKTNVGYGKFDTFTVYRTEEERLLASAEEEEDKFDDIMNSQEDLSKQLESIDTFKVTYPKSTFSEAIATKMEEIKLLIDKGNVENAYEKLTKTNQNHVNIFIKKYEQIDYAKEWVDKAKLLFGKEPVVVKTSSDLSILDEKFKDGKTFKNTLNSIDKSLRMSVEGKAAVKKNVLRTHKELSGKKQKKFFAELQLSNLMDIAFNDEVKAEAESS